MNGTQTVEIPLSEFDLELLPKSARDRNSEACRQAISAFVESQFKGFAGWAQIVVDSSKIQVTWQSKPESPKPIDEAVRLLNRGEHQRAIQLLKFLHAARPQDAIILYNLGMALSDIGKLSEAERKLRKALEIEAEMTNAKVALGVALARDKKLDAAVEVLEDALGDEPDNPYALRGLAGCLLNLGRDLPRAEQSLRNAIKSLPNDQQSWIGLAQVLEVQKKIGDAEAAFAKVIEINPASEIAYAAKRAQTRIAEGTFRTSTAGVPRPDAMMHCLAALRAFEKMTPQQIQNVAFEIAALGTKGINPNNPNARYSLRSLSGEFSGLQLLCYMFTAFKQIKPDADIGFDVSKEYEVAITLHKGQH
jgi:tetratricopeptide (TPR) repeat protein